jgi:hypothetical protein
MLITAVLDGYSASTRKVKTQDIVRDRLLDAKIPFVFKGKKAMFMTFRARQMRRYIHKYDDHENTLLCVGKSFGAKTMVQGVLNKFHERLHYEKICLVTIDPNWPTNWDLTPNLNDHELRLIYPVDHAYNVYVLGAPRQQCGARLVGPDYVKILNQPVLNYDHYDVIHSPAVALVLDKALSA